MEKLTKEQIAIVFEAFTGMPPRTADVAIIDSLGGTPDVLAEYLWDHWMGEPRSPSLKKVTKQVNDMLNTIKEQKK